MTQISWPWDTNPPEGGPGDGAVGFNEANARAFLAHLWAQDLETEGIFKGLGGALEGELAVSGAASPLEVQPGAAICYGLYISNDVETLAVATPAVGTTGGRVVLRTNWAGTSDGAVGEAETRLAVKLSSDGVADIPGLTQVAGTTWEISLATFTITTGGVITLTDDRTFRRLTGVLPDNAVERAMIVDGAVDDAKIGERVALVTHRQGDSSVSWFVPGTNTYVPGRVGIQVGLFTSTHDEGGREIVFPVPFAKPPLVFLQTSPSGPAMDVLLPQEDKCFIAPVPPSLDNIVVQWLAIGEIA